MAHGRYDREGCTRALRSLSHVGFLWTLDQELGISGADACSGFEEFKGVFGCLHQLVTDVFSSIADVSQAVGPGGELGNSELLQQFLAEVLGVSGNQAVLVAGPLVPELLEDEIDLGGRTVGPTGGDAFPVGVVWVLGRRYRCPCRGGHTPIPLRRRFGRRRGRRHRD
nr:hypothetical protein Iba_chr06bCG14550 [Ipomoea batatas]